MADVKNGTLPRDEEEALVDTIKSISLAYGIITPYTSMFFAAPDDDGYRAVYEGLTDSVGQGANEVSNYQNSMQSATNADQTVVMDAADISWYVAPTVSQVQNIGSKIFVYSPDSLWVDATLGSAGVFDTVYYGSEEYFSLAAEDPQLLEYLTVGSRAAIAYEGTNYVILDTNHVVALLPAKSHVRGPGKLRVVSQRGNSVMFGLPRTSVASTVEIFSVSGALTATLQKGKSDAVATWYRTDNSGHAVANGMYTVVFRNKATMQSKRFLLVR